MNLTRCNNGHFYDAEKFGSCPHCSSNNRDYSETVPYDENNLTQMQEEGMGLKELVEEVTGGSEDESKTISFYNKVIGSEPVVGWLVCTEGSHFGEDFRLTGGRNFIGRSVEMDIALTGDKSISREKHAIILYEPMENIFMIQPGDSRELSYLNGKVILGAEVIKANDVLAVGETKLMFIPCCSEQFKWENAKKEEK